MNIEPMKKRRTLLELLEEMEKRLETHYPGGYSEVGVLEQDVNLCRIAYYQGKKSGIRQAILLVKLEEHIQEMERANEDSNRDAGGAD